MLVGAASQASSFIPIPGSAASITATALNFVFDIPEAIKGYNDCVDQVFGKVSSALAQFQIYRSMDMDKSDPRLNKLIRQIHLVLVSFVKVCAHVVQHRQARKRDYLGRMAKFILDGTNELGREVAEFEQLLQLQRDVEGTLTLAVVVETRHDMALLLEKSIIFGRMTEETHQAVQALKDDADHIKTLIKIRDALGVPSTVRLESNTTGTCTMIAEKCLPGTGSWIWTHSAYTTWVTPKDKDKDTPRLLLLSGAQSSGKTSASALIIKRLEEKRGRAYSAHYFFPASTKKNDDDKNPNPVHSALKYMAFQIARSDITLQKALEKACDLEPSPFRHSASTDNLDSLWKELKIGVTGSGASYYLVFDGIEHLPEKQSEMLLRFIQRVAEDSARRVHIMASGTNDNFAKEPGLQSALRIQMEEHNRPDMRIFIEETLNSQEMLRNAPPGSNQQKARDKIIEKLSGNVKGSYSRLKFGLDDVIRLLSTRTAIRELDQMLDQSISSHEAAIKNLQQSLTADEIKELNELLKWALYGNEPMTLDQLEAAMFLFSQIESLASLQYIIKTKYSAVLKLEDGYVYGQDGVKDYLQKEKDASGRSLHSKDRATISMTITVNNVDEELCGHFLWDLAQKAIRDKFKFNFDAAGSTSLHSSSQGVIAVDEFEAHHTIVKWAFVYLKTEPSAQTEEIGKYLVRWLPYHLNRLGELDEERGELMQNERLQIGEELYGLFKDDAAFRRHKATLEQNHWTAEEMDDMQKWFKDLGVVRTLDKAWRNAVQSAASPVRGYLKELVATVVRGLLRERSWEVHGTWLWIEQFMRSDVKEHQKASKPSEEDNADSDSDASSAGSSSKIDWYSVGAWCQDILGLSESELDSLWYERLAEVSSSESSLRDVTISLYERAIEKENPSWLCHRGLGQTLRRELRTLEAIEQVELALTAAGRDDASPKPEARDIVDLHLRLGHYALAAKDMKKSADHYALACKSDDARQANEALMGHLRVMLRSSDREKTRELLQHTLDREDGQEKMAGVLKLIAQSPRHDTLVLPMFTAVKADPDLLRGVVRAMETATATLEEQDWFAEKRARGMATDGAEPVSEALRLWTESRNQLADIGGSVAFLTRQKAADALARHYFQGMLDGSHLDDLDKLAKLAESDESDSSGIYNQSAGFQAVVLARNGKREQARAVLAQRVELSLQILSDDVADNDALGFSILHKTLELYQDFENAAIALSLLVQPDLVTSALDFEADNVADGDDKQRVLDMVRNLAKDTVQAAKTQVPDARQQVQRIEAARAYAETLTKPESHDADEKATASALRLLESRLSYLHETHTPTVDLDELGFTWYCDGRTADGVRCNNGAGFENEFYHCVYCSACDFCRDCLDRLRDPTTDGEITACSPNHLWFQIPPYGGDMFPGPKAKSVRVPARIETVDGDEQILRARYAENSDGPEITVDAWKERLAAEWDISLEEIRHKISRQNTRGGEEETKGE